MSGVIFKNQKSFIKDQQKHIMEEELSFAESEQLKEVYRVSKLEGYMDLLNIKV